jgi:hypothetical protein
MGDQIIRFPQYSGSVKITKILGNLSLMSGYNQNIKETNKYAELSAGSEISERVFTR